MFRGPALRLLFALTLIAAPLGTAFAKQQGDLMIRLRGIAMIPMDDGVTDAIGGDAKLDNDYVPEIDFTYFLTDHLALELIAASTKHSAKVTNNALGRTVELGTVRLLPPTLTLQYHFMPKKKFSPYIGGGINYTFFFDIDTGNDAAVQNVDYDNAVGGAVQVGFDYQLNDNWSVNFDVKKLWLQTDITVNEGAINAQGADVSPIVIGVGVGYRFNTGWGGGKN
jgi:outer membrane protein